MNKLKIFFSLNLKYNFFNYLYLSLLLIVVGIFLLPNLAFMTSISEERIIELTNKERLKNDLSAVTANQLLSKAAREKGKAIFLSQIFGHSIDDRKFSAWIKDAGYKYFYAGENLAIDFITSEGAIEAWLKSPTHKKNILNENFSEIGVAVLEGEFMEENTTIIVQIFGSPLPKTVVINPLKPTLLAGYQEAPLNIPSNLIIAKPTLASLDDSVSNLPTEVLLTHSSGISLINPTTYAVNNKLQSLNTYKLINSTFKKLNINKILEWGEINLFNNSLIPNYLLLSAFILASLLLSIIYIDNKKLFSYNIKSKAELKS